MIENVKTGSIICPDEHKGYIVTFSENPRQNDQKIPEAKKRHLLSTFWIPDFPAWVIGLDLPDYNPPVYRPQRKTVYVDELVHSNGIEKRLSSSSEALPQTFDT